MYEKFFISSLKAGWNQDSQIQILLEYIENQKSDEAFQDFLAEKIASEKEMDDESHL